jgi:hypothetical protein
VIPKADPEAAYLQSVRDFANYPLKVTQRILDQIYKTGVPKKDVVPDHVILTAITREYKRLIKEKSMPLSQPSDSTLLRAAGRKK